MSKIISWKKVSFLFFIRYAAPSVYFALYTRRENHGGNFSVAIHLVMILSSSQKYFAKSIKFDEYISISLSINIFPFFADSSLFMENILFIYT